MRRLQHSGGRRHRLPHHRRRFHGRQSLRICRQSRRHRAQVCPRSVPLSCCSGRRCPPSYSRCGIRKQTLLLDVSSSCVSGHLMFGRCVSTTRRRLYFTFVSTPVPFLSVRTPSDCPSPTIYTPLRSSRFVYDNKNPYFT